MDEECEAEMKQFESLIPGLPEELAMRCLATVPKLALLRGVCSRWQEVIDKSEDLLALREKIGESAIEWLYTLIRRDDGTFGWYAFDPSASRWHPLPPMPEVVDFQLLNPGSIGSSHAVQCVSTKNKLVMLAGLRRSVCDNAKQQWSRLEPALEHPWVFDTRTCSWRKGKQFGTPRAWCVCGVVDDEVYVASGCGKRWTAELSRITEKYDPETDSWETLPCLDTSRFSGEAITAVNVKGKLHITTGNGMFVKEGAVFCSVTRKWSKMHFGLKSGWTGSCVSVNDNFYVLETCTGKLTTYDPIEDQWKLLIEDSRLIGLSDLISKKGKLCALVQPRDGEAHERSFLRIIDVFSRPPRIFDTSGPRGRVVSMQILSRLSFPC